MDIKPILRIRKMKLLFQLFAIIIMINTSACNAGKPEKINKQLTPEEESVIINKATEPPFSGKYWKSTAKGTYICKNCGAELYQSDDKFNSHCGWASFDDEIPNAIKRVPDADGMRIEIVCNKCGGHLGHVFEGERQTKKNVRHCVNSLSMDFVPAAIPSHAEKAIFAAGCFWGVEALFKQLEGVHSIRCGYIGGHKVDPTYQEVFTGETGHQEAVEILYNPEVISYEELAKYFFELHDPTQENGQGPDIGEQYHSVIFYDNDEQLRTAEKLINILENRGMKIATKVIKSTKFYPAEEYHQDYYAKKGSKPYCHFRRKLF